MRRQRTEVVVELRKVMKIHNMASCYQLQITLKVCSLSSQRLATDLDLFKLFLSP